MNSYGSHFNLFKKTNIRCEVFYKSTPYNISCFTYMEFDATIEIEMSLQLYNLKHQTEISFFKTYPIISLYYIIFQYPEYPSSFIVNTDTSGEPGTHWLYYDINGNCTFFDSFGQHP